MATGLGLRIGHYESVAAIVSTGHEADPEYIVHDTVLHMGDDGDAVLGGTAPEGHPHTVSEFIDGVGDPAGVVVDHGAAFRAEDLMASAIFCLINEASDKLVAPAEIVATYPTQWDDHVLESLRDSLDYLGLRSLTLMSEADAAAHHGDEAALGAALSAHTAAQATENLFDTGFASTETQEISAPPTPKRSTPVVDALAYSAAVPVVPIQPLAEVAGYEDIPTEYDQPAIPAAAPEKAAVRSHTPLLVGVGIAAVLAIGGGATAIALSGNDTTAVPPIHNAEISQTTTPAPRPAAPIAFSTAEAPAPEQYVAPAEPVVPVQPVDTPAPAPVVPPPPALPPPPPVVIEPTTTVAPTTTTTVPTTTDTTDPTTTTPTEPPYGQNPANGFDPRAPFLNGTLPTQQIPQVPSLN